MRNSSKLAVICTNWNELVYLKNLIPQFQRVADEIHIVDDFSTDGSKEWIESLNDTRIDFFQRKFDTCPQQFDSVLKRCSKDNTWVWCATPDEVPTTYWFENIRTILEGADSKGIDRIWCSVFHMRGLRETSEEVGREIRLFRNDEKNKCEYVGFPHERLNGIFSGDHDENQDGRFAICHFKQADKSKVALWKTDYVEKLIYSAKDVSRRLKYNTVALPEDIRYEITDELKEYICSQ